MINSSSIGSPQFEPPRVSVQEGVKTVVQDIILTAIETGHVSTVLLKLQSASEHPEGLLTDIFLGPILLFGLRSSPGVVFSTGCLACWCCSQGEDTLQTVMLEPNVPGQCGPALSAE